jgi:hypothetical protein
MSSLRFSKTEWTLLSVASFTILFTLSGCFGRGSLPTGGNGSSFLSGGPGGVLSYLAIISTAVAGTALLACSFLAVFYQDKVTVAKLAIACFGTIIIAQIVWWFGKHTALAAGLVALTVFLGAGFWVWVHRRALAKKAGLCGIKVAIR